MNFYNMKTFFLGFILFFLYHLPKYFGVLLKKSYKSFYFQSYTLTASPAEHLKRARKILKYGSLSELLYAAIEIRFALERMTQKELIFAENSSNKMLDETSPVKKVSNTHKLNPDSAFHHEVYLINPQTKERYRWGTYKPLDKKKVSYINGRLGDLLHPKEGLRLGIPNDPWYISTKSFLNESRDYLAEICKDNAGFFSNVGSKNMELVKVIEREP